MKRLATRGVTRRSEDDSVLPLINVVFLLLIFFMLAGRLTVGDPFEIAPPRSESAAHPETPEILVLLSADGRIAVDGRVVGPDEMARLLSAASAPEVRLKADGGIDASRVIELMERIRAAGVRNLDLLTLPGAE